MKKIFFIMFLFPVALWAQDQYPYQLPEYATVANDSTDVLYIDDSGVDKHIEMPTLLDAVHDTANQIRSEYNDSISDLRGEISGGGGWSKSGTRMYPTSNNDSVSIGTATPSEKLSVQGNISASSHLKAGGSLYLNNYTYLNSTDYGVIDIYGGGGMGLAGRIISGITSLDLQTTSAASYLLIDNAYIDFNAGAAQWYLMSNGFWRSSADTLATRAYSRSCGGGGSGTLDTTGLPVAGQLAVFTEAAKIGGYANLRYVYNTLRLNAATGDTGLYMTNASGIGIDLNQSTTGTALKIRYNSSNIFHVSRDSVFMDRFAGADNIWWTASINAAFDTAHWEPPWIGLTCKLSSIWKVMKDYKWVNGHKELKWTYIDDKTGMITEQYGLAGLSPTEAVNAIGAETEKNKRHILRLWIENKIMFLLIVLIVIYLIKRK